VIGSDSVIKSNLKELLEARRLNMRDFERLSGIRFESIRQLYHGTMTRIPVDMLEKVCTTLNVTPNDVLKVVTGDEPGATPDPSAKKVKLFLSPKQKTVIDNLRSGNRLSVNEFGKPAIVTKDGEDVVQVSKQTINSLERKGLIEKADAPIFGSAEYTLVDGGETDESKADS
jgi:DNA-binding Xre family transcriptional regulator